MPSPINSRLSQLPPPPTMLSPPILAAIYLRMSSDQQDESIEAQRKAVLEYAAKNGYAVRPDLIYIDEARPGWREDRKAFTQLIADAQAGKFAAILCWDQDRFSRFPVLEANHYWFLLDRAGVHISTVAQGRLDFASLAGWLTASIAQHGKSEYCRDLARNTSRGLRKRKLGGDWVGKAPIGYTLENGKLVPGPPESVAAVRRIFAERAEGRGTVLIANRLNQSGVPAPRGGTWSGQAVRHILQREAYIGVVVIGKWSRAKYERLTPGLVTIAGAHPAIIDQATWAAVKEVDARPQPARHKGDGEGAALSGLLICGRCGKPMYSRRFLGEHRREAYYLCSTRTAKGGCGHCAVDQDAMLGIVTRKIREKVLLGSPERLAAAIDRQLAKRAAANVAAPRIDRAGLGKQLAAVERKIQNAAERLVTVAASLVPTLETKMIELQAQREGILRQLSASDVVDLPAARLDPAAIATEIWRLNDVLVAGSASVVRRELSKIVAGITVEFEHVRTTPGGYEKYRPVGGAIELRETALTECTNAAQHSERLLRRGRSKINLTRRDFAA